MLSFRNYEGQQMPFKDKEKARTYANARARAYYAANKEKRQAKARAEYWADPERARANAAAWKAANPERKRGHTRKYNLSKYGITPEEYDTLVERENGVCAICGSPPSESRALDVDHGPNKQFVRGLLCNPCNRGLASFRDNPRHLAAAVVYLMERQCPS